MLSITQTERLPLGTIGVTVPDLPLVLNHLDKMVHDGGGHYVCFCDSNLFVHAQRNPKVAVVLNRSSMTFPDGVMLVVMSHLLGSPLPQRLPGPSFMLDACKHGLAQGYRHFFYGGQEGIAEELAKRLCERFPGLIVAGTYTPPFHPLTEEEEEDVRQAVTRARPDLLWVGLCEPQQSLWMANHVHALGVPVMLGVGAAFDFHSGRVPWAPRWIRRIGMEWAYRSLTGGRRILRRNLWCVSMSLLLMLREVWRVRFLQRIIFGRPTTTELPQK